MARIRSIHPPIFTDEGFVSLSMAARVLLLGIWTEADDHGVFEWKPVTLKMRIMPVDNVSIPELLAECETANVIKRFTDGKSYGLVRNFCLYQRPKKPKYTHPMPVELRTYAGLKADGSLQVLHQSRTSGEMSPQREEEGGMMEDESENEKEGGEKPARSDLKIVSEAKAVPIDLSYEPSEPAVEYAYSLGMKAADLKSEQSKFIAKAMMVRKVSFNPDMDFKLWCDRWLDFKRKDNPDWKPAPDLPAAAMVSKVFVIKDTLGWKSWVAHLLETRKVKWSKFVEIKDEAGRVKEGWWWPAEFAPGYDEATGEKLVPAGEENAA